MGSIRKIWRVFKEYWGFDDLFAILLLLIGLAYFFREIPENTSSPILIFYQDIHAELIGIGITVLIITNADQVVRTKLEKRRLIIQIGSHDNGFALEAARQMEELGWLRNSIPNGVSLCKANLKEAELDGISLINANLNGIILEEASLNDANLSGSDLENSNLKWIDLGSANLKGAFLSHANLENAYLDRAHLENTSLIAANLENANLRLAHLEGADLYNTNLKKAFLGEAILTGANLAGADLRQIRYNNCTKWDNAFYDHETIWPEGFDPEESGCVKEDERKSLYY